MLSYEFLVQTRREELKKHRMLFSGDMEKADKLVMEEKWKPTSPKRGDKEVQRPQCTQEASSACVLSCSESQP